MLADREYAEELRKKFPNTNTENINETFIDTVITEMPNLSNRQIYLRNMMILVNLVHQGLRVFSEPLMYLKIRMGGQCRLRPSTRSEQEALSF